MDDHDEEMGILHYQPFINGPPINYLLDHVFDLFHFTLRAPASGSGTVTITPEIFQVFAWTSDNFNDPLVPSVVPASFTYIPAPGTALCLAALGAASILSTQRRR